MGGTTRVPIKDSEFHLYITTSTAYLLMSNSPAHFERLGLTQQEMDDWEAYKDNWLVQYGLWGNPNTRTKTVTQLKNQLIDDFRAFSESLLDRMSGSADITQDDRNALHIASPDRTPTARGQIDVTPVIGLESRPGGIVRVTCRTAHDAVRASMHPLADGIEMRAKIGSPAPATYNDCPLVFTTSKAIFDYSTGAGNAEKRIYIYCRYVNLGNPGNSGAFGSAVNVVIEE